MDKYLESGVKTDNNKPSMSLIDPDFLVGLAKVLDFGKEKYAAHNWRGGIKFSRLISAAYRHLGEINRGEDMDHESGLPHVYHLACCIMFLSWMMENRNDLDDRWKRSNLEKQTSEFGKSMGEDHKIHEAATQAEEWVWAGPNKQPGESYSSWKKTLYSWEKPIYSGNIKVGV